MTDATNPRVDFYLLPGQNNNNIRAFCCRLAEKAWKLGNTVSVRVENENEAQLMDNLLWTFNEGSFLPHARLEDNLETETPVVIILKQEAADKRDLLINLASDVPEQLGSYQRIAEILNDDNAIKQHGRQRYSYYDKNNYPLQHHKIKN